MSLDDLPPLRDVVAAHGLAARKGLGQHFLFDLNLTDKIARCAGPLNQRTVLEIGPGPGALTRSLLKAGAAKVIAVEKDPRCAPALADIAACADERLVILEADALEIDERRLIQEHGGGRDVVVAANLPYNIGTALLLKWLTCDPWWSTLVLMFQKEVAERITATPADDAYGRLAVITSLRAHAEIVFDLPARAFTPPPKVESAVVRLTPRQDAFADVTALATVTHAAFSQRRKMLRRSLKSLGDAEALIVAAGVASDARPETVPPERFAALATAWRKSNARG